MYDNQSCGLKPFVVSMKDRLFLYKCLGGAAFCAVVGPLLLWWASQSDRQGPISDTPESAKTVFGLICCVMSGVFFLYAAASKWIEFYEGTEVAFDGEGICHRFAFRRERFVPWDSFPYAVIQHMQQRVKVDNLGFAALLGFGPIGRILYEVLTPTTYRYFDALIVKSDTIQVSYPVDDLTAERLQNWLCSRQIAASVKDWGGSVKWGEFGLTEIDVGGTRITNSQFQPIANGFESLKELRRLNLNGTKMTNDIFAHFGPSNSLREIDHIGTAISHQEVTALLEQAPPEDKR